MHLFTDHCCRSLQVETGSAITWKYPSVVLKGDNSIGEFYSVALTNNAQQADTGAFSAPCRLPSNATFSSWHRAALARG